MNGAMLVWLVGAGASSTKTADSSACRYVAMHEHDSTMSQQSAATYLLTNDECQRDQDAAKATGRATNTDQVIGILAVWVVADVVAITAWLVTRK